MPRRSPILVALGVLAGLTVFFAGLVILWGTIIRPGSVVFLEERIGVLPVEGIIMDPQELLSEMRKFRKDSTIKAVILRINSPGGAVAPSQEICSEVKRLSMVKPVVASLGAVAASGGYYIAAPCRIIVANPGTLTGSIGVLMQFLRVEELLQKLGVQLEVLKAGQYKDMGSPHRKLTDKEKEMITEVIEDVRSQFIDEVVRGRNLPREKVAAVADGRIFTGAKAKELGLVDRLGGLEEAALAAKELADLKGEPRLVFPKKASFRILELLGESALGGIKKGLLKQTLPDLSYLWPGSSEAAFSENN